MIVHNLNSVYHLNYHLLPNFHLNYHLPGYLSVAFITMCAAFPGHTPSVHKLFGDNNRSPQDSLISTLKPWDLITAETETQLEVILCFRGGWEGKTVPKCVATAASVDCNQLHIRPLL